MKSNKSFIFDLDGTFYQFAPGGNITFHQSSFYSDLKRRIGEFIMGELGIDQMAAAKIISEIDEKFNGELSIGFERTYGIDRYKYYEATWRCDPKTYIATNTKLAGEMFAFKGRSLLLTAAPRSWATKVLRHLNIEEIFGDNIITGEPDIRKPDPKVFEQAAAKLGVHPKNIVSVGDQNHSDILPAKSLGMTTLIVGPHKQDADHQATDIFEAITILKEKLL